MAGKASNSLNRSSPATGQDSTMNKSDCDNSGAKLDVSSASDEAPNPSTIKQEVSGSINTTMTHEDGDHADNDMQRMIEKEENKGLGTPKTLPKRFSYGSTCESTPLRPTSVQSTSLTDNGEVTVIIPGSSNDAENSTGIVINITSGDSNPSSQTGSCSRPLPRGLDFTRLRPYDVRWLISFIHFLVTLNHSFLFPRLDPWMPNRFVRPKVNIISTSTTSTMKGKFNIMIKGLTKQSIHWSLL